MDTNFLLEALKNWQDRNHDSRDFQKLSPAEQSAIMGDAQTLKANATVGKNSTSKMEVTA